MKLVTGVPVTCQQLVLAARAGKACMRSVCMYTCVWGCVSDGSSLCVWQYGHLHLKVSFLYHTGPEGRRVVLNFDLSLIKQKSKNGGYGESMWETGYLDPIQF